MKKIVDCMVGKRRIVITEDPNYSEMSWACRYTLFMNDEYYNEDNDVIQLLEGSGLPYWLYTDYYFPEGDEE